MKLNKCIKKICIIYVTLVLVSTVLFPYSYAEKNYSKTITCDEEIPLNISYIENITKALSYIVFTEYDESKGEIAKGRAFGTKGEHKAAEVLFENMTNLGLYTQKDRIKNLKTSPFLTHKIDIHDFGLFLNKSGEIENVDCHITPAMLGPFGSPLKISNNYSYKDLKIRTEHPKIFENNEEYVLIYNSSVPTAGKMIFSSNPTFKLLFGTYTKVIRDIYDRIRYPHYKGRIHIDSQDDTFDMPFSETVFPKICINGSVGNKITEKSDEYRISFYINQSLNNSVESYNVIGQINGTNPDKTIIVGCLYDCWWNQGTADSAIGMGIVMGLAKYFKENKIQPNYTIKFVGFGGEEYGMRGSKYYVANNSKEKIEYMLDLNQLGWNQTEPRLTLQVAGNDKRFLNEIWEVIEPEEYINKTNNLTDITPVHMPFGHISDDRSFALARPYFLPFRGIKTICFLKNGPWPNHHRDGMNHTKGDVFEYFDKTDVQATGELILKSLLHLSSN